MSATPSLPDQEIIELLESLTSLDAEYPPELLRASRTAFLQRISQRQARGNEAFSTRDQKIIEQLESMRSQTAGYPAELWSARRMAFVSEVRRRDGVEVEETQRSQDQEIVEILQGFEFLKADYPAELLSARRAAFMSQVAERISVGAQKQISSNHRAIPQGFNKLKTAEAEYPPELWVARRRAFLGQVARQSPVSLLDALRSTIQSWLGSLRSASLIPWEVMRTSLVLAGLLLATLIGSLAYGGQNQLQELASPSAPQEDMAQPIVASATSTQVLAEKICKPGYAPPLCLAQEFDKSQDLTYQGNGARAAVAKDTLPGFAGVHQAAYINDGLYGPGSSWVSNSAYSWIKIDLGKTSPINTVAFGRDRLGNFKDRNPGQFVIAVAMFDNIYADGNSSNDNLEYIQVYNSQSDGFPGSVSGPETITASFGPVLARYVKITFTNAGTAIDEVEVFMVQPPPILADNSPRRDGGGDSRRPTNSPTPLPTNTPLPTSTSTPPPTNTPTLVPTNTPLPTNTSIPVPTSTPQPTNTASPVPTNTPRPTSTPLSGPTNTPVSIPTNIFDPTTVPTVVPLFVVP